MVGDLCFVRFPFAINLVKFLQSKPFGGIMSKLRATVPEGKIRVVSVDKHEGVEYLVKDCDTSDEAFKLADEQNRERKTSYDSPAYVYDHQGTLLRSPEDRLSRNRE